MRTARNPMATIVAGLVLLAAGAATALPVVRYTVTSLGGGLFQYDLEVDNAGGAEDLSGLNVLHAGSEFFLDGSSVVTAPPGWGSFSPLPPLIDDLNYFSLSPLQDVPVDGVLGTFSFQSTRDPSTLDGDDFAVEGIGADTATQIGLGVAVLVPEPATGMLVGFALAALAAARRR